MRGLQVEILPSLPRPYIIGAPFDVLRTVAGAFAKHPYPETFFTWGAGRSPAVSFYFRADRPPSWMHTDADRFPVVVRSEPATGRRLLDRIGKDVVVGHRFSVFDMAQGTTRYQVVAYLWYNDALRQQPVGGVGFMVNMNTPSSRCRSMFQPSFRGSGSIGGRSA